MEKIHGYSSDINVQMLIALMKAHGVKRVIVSPGTTHMDLVASLQYDEGFEMYSTIDERGASYMAVGMAAESKAPVAIICTESVASRNYYSAMTEAYYRQLPIVAITGLHDYARIGHLQSQIIDRNISPTDTFRCKVHLPMIKDAEDIWESNVLLNKAFLELKHHGGGPVHIDLPWRGENDFSAKELVSTRIIHRYGIKDDLPSLPHGKIAVFIGTHTLFDNSQTKLIDRFCAENDAVVFCGHTGGYKGEYQVSTELAAFQKTDYDIFNNIDLLIHIGGPASIELTSQKLKKVKAVWRIDPDGEIRDYFKKDISIFEMDCMSFFDHYCISNGLQKKEYLNRCMTTMMSIVPPLDKLPLSHVYIASGLSSRLPADSLIHFGNSNSIRAWNLFRLPSNVRSSCNTGVRGIDGVLSAFIGASFVDRNRICFCVVGDLAFFYDLNSLGNRDIGNNIRILLVNDNGGGLMKMSISKVYNGLGENDAGEFLAASGHFGAQSHLLVKEYAENLGFEYISASSKEEFDTKCERFITSEITDKPIIFEVFTRSEDERTAFDLMYNIDVSLQGAAKQAVKQIIGQKGVNAIKKVINSNGRKN